jgi:hypothetical protein
VLSQHSLEVKTMISARRQIRSRPEARSLGLWILPSLLIAVLLVGCDDEAVDRTPPAIPSGVYSVTGDQQISLVWIPNLEIDLAGYSVWWNDDGGDEYREIARFERFDPDYYVEYVDSKGRKDPAFDFVEYVDAGDEGLGLPNGSVHYYAVSAVDTEGNESDLSLEYISDVPRPAGQVLLEARGSDPAQSGFDFSSETVQDFAAIGTDLWFEVVGNVPYLNVASATVRIQDYGKVGFDVLSEAPDGGWSVAGRTEAITGHSYAFEITTGSDVNYAKVTVESLVAADDNPPPRWVADLKWAYQSVANEFQLKGPSSSRGSGRVRVRKNAS